MTSMVENTGTRASIDTLFPDLRGKGYTVDSVTLKEEEKEGAIIEFIALPPKEQTKENQIIKGSIEVGRQGILSEKEYRQLPMELFLKFMQVTEEEVSCWDIVKRVKAVDRFFEAQASSGGGRKKWWGKK